MAGSVDITQAKVIVSGGRGTKEKDKYNDVIVNLAKKLGGEFAASRPVVTPVGPMPPAGRAVRKNRRPGALHSRRHLRRHPARRRYERSQCIVAINKDPEAPIFNIATYGSSATSSKSFGDDGALG
jgi:electron transfer flavoprotein alpha subunit